MFSSIVFLSFVFSPEDDLNKGRNVGDCLKCELFYLAKLRKPVPIEENSIDE